MVLADHLSWFLSAKESLPIPIPQNIQHIQLSAYELDAVWGAIECDQVYSTLHQLTLGGWPDCLQLVLRVTQHYWCTQEELSIEAGIILKGDCICFPPEILDRMLAEIHGAHQGIEKMQALAWEAVYWPGIDVDITNYVKRCAISTTYKASLPAQPMLPWDIPSSPWQKIVADYFNHSSKDYLLIADLFSRYPFLFCIISKLAQVLIQKLQEFISKYGPPSILYSNNGPSSQLKNSKGSSKGSA